MVLAYITCKNKAEARKMASSLLEQKLIACANLFPIESMYNWKGKLQKDKEFALLVKTAASKYKQMEKEVKKLHSYEIPCILRLAAKANREYEKWVEEEVN